MRCARLAPVILGMAAWGVFLALAACVAAPAAEAAGAQPSYASPKRLAQRSTNPAKQQMSWLRALGIAVQQIHSFGPGRYDAGKGATAALVNAFAWDERRKRLLFNPAGARPSFCSGAVYAATLSALIQWDSMRRVISAEAWQALQPQDVADGIGPWGYANANGPGFAMLVRRLKAGASFTDLKLAKPGDVLKIWWTDTVGAGERGHLVIFIREEKDSLLTWSSNKPRDGAADGYGYKSVPKNTIRHMLFTRITRPEAFDHAARVGTDDWLRSLMRQNTTWDECLRRAGVLRSVGEK